MTILGFLTNRADLGERLRSIAFHLGLPCCQSIRFLVSSINKRIKITIKLWAWWLVWAISDIHGPFMKVVSNSWLQKQVYSDATIDANDCVIPSDCINFAKIWCCEFYIYMYSTTWYVPIDCLRARRGGFVFRKWDTGNNQMRQDSSPTCIYWKQKLKTVYRHTLFRCQLAWAEKSI